MVHNALQPPQEVTPPQGQLPYGEYPQPDQYQHYGHEGFGPIGSGGWPQGTVEANWGAYPNTDYYDPNHPFAAGQEYRLLQQPAYEAQAAQPEQPQTVGRGRLAWEGLKKFFRFGRRGEPQEAEGSEVFDERPQLSQEAESFWNGEVQAVARAPRFLDQVHEVRASQDPNFRSNVITSQSKEILEGRRSKLQFTEAEGLLDLDNFLGQVIRTAYGKSDQASRSALESAMRMKEEFSFLGEKEFNEACDGIAQMWKEYLEQDEGNVLNIYNHQRVGFDGRTEQKSFNVVLDKITERFTERIKNEPYLALRVKDDPEKWVDAPGAKLVVVDDWMSSGNTIRTNAQKAGALAERMGLPGLNAKSEAHVLIARADQSAVNYVVQGGKVTAPVRSYYKTAHDSGAHRLSLSGAHSSVDYGFETPLANMQQYLSSHNVVREEPLLTHIQRSYQADAEMAPEQVAMLQEVASLNGLEEQLSAEIQALNAEILRSPQSQDSPQLSQRAAAYSSKVAVEKRRQNLVDEYKHRFVNPDK